MRAHWKKALIVTGLAVLSLGLAGCHRGDRTEHILKRMDHKVKKLDLTEAQKQKYAEIRTKVATELKQSFGTRQRVRESLRAEFGKEAPDIRSASASMEKLILDRGQSFSRLPGYFAEFYETLNPEQKAKVLKTIRRRLDL